MSPRVDEEDEVVGEREKMAERARRGAADLGDGLKTTREEVQGIGRRHGERGEDAEGFALKELANEMEERIDYQMRLAA
ncbi:hypothetical protein, partial [Devosia chinhatensis]